MEMDIRKLCFHCFQEKADPAAMCPHCGFTPPVQTQYPLALPAGSVLAGRYLVGRVLGQGGFG
ncbi:MAG: histidine kinase, partial [Clostridia bacterium]|nr:histidine kinase [Clostridia bacterium]